MGNQRTLVMLEPPVRKMVKEIAKEEGVSISYICRDLIHKALEIMEDRYFDKLASEREKNFNWKKNGLTHEQVWEKKRK
ncbi:MAG: antitoxin, RHH family protein [Elusimicrobia bacterium]|nr:antitoxin, RHH family protein [Elusimicrobiota bacterium]